MLVNVSAVLFDLDGTLVDSGLDFQVLRDKLGCPTGIDVLTFLADLPSLQQRAEGEQTVHEFEMAGAALSTWMPGAKALLEAFASAGIATGIVTRNTRAAFDVCSTRLAIPPIDVITREDAPAKPDPAGLLTLAKKFSVLPENTIYVGDYIYDLQAAKAAGMRSCLYDPRGDASFADLADVCIHHFDQLATLLSGAINTR